MRQRSSLTETNNVEESFHNPRKPRVGCCSPQYPGLFTIKLAETLQQPKQLGPSSHGSDHLLSQPQPSNPKTVPKTKCTPPRTGHPYPKRFHDRARRTKDVAAQEILLAVSAAPPRQTLQAQRSLAAAFTINSRALHDKGGEYQETAN